MSMESDLLALLKTVCPTVWEDDVPAGTVPPYVTWQQIGGRPLRAIDGAALDKRNSLIQINAWSKTRTESRTMIRAIENALCTSALFAVEQQDEAQSTTEDEPKLYGKIQRFSIYAART